MTRRLALEGIDNFRDFGDYPTQGGGRLKRGRLYRSASHGRATDADLAAVDALGLAVVVDLRRPNERERDPSRRPNGFSGQVIANDLGAEEADSWHTHIRTSDLSVASFRAYMFDYYHRAPFELRHIDLYSRYFQALAQSQGPILIHCAAGKDRTGLLAALTHHLAGVAPDDIMEDYLLTNDATRMAARAPMVAAHIEEIGGRAPSPETLSVAMRVEPEYLTAAFDMIAEKRGNADAYLEQDLGVTPALRDTLRARLLA